MKKRLLITSIVMMLVVAVALSTATYAWFTSNAGVTATSITLTADSNSGLALGISWGTNGTVGTQISAYGGGTLKPIMPQTLTESSTAPNVAFSGGTTYSKAGVTTFNTPVYTAQEAAAYYYKEASNGTDIIKLTNLAVSGGNPIASITVTPTISAVTNGKDASDLVRIAIFYSADNTDYTLVKVLANNSEADGTVYGTATADKAVGTGSEAEAAKSGVCIQGIYDAAQTCTLPTVSTGVTIAAASDIYVKVVMWMDGQAFTDAYATYDASVALTFTAA